MVFIAIAALATLVPVWRATRVDPVAASRQKGYRQRLPLGGVPL